MLIDRRPLRRGGRLWRAATWGRGRSSPPMPSCVAEVAFPRDTVATSTRGGFRLLEADAARSARGPMVAARRREPPPPRSPSSRGTGCGRPGDRELGRPGEAEESVAGRRLRVDQRRRLSPRMPRSVVAVLRSPSSRTRSLVSASMSLRGLGQGRVARVGVARAGRGQVHDVDGHLALRRGHHRRSARAQPMPTSSGLPRGRIAAPQPTVLTGVAVLEHPVQLLGRPGRPGSAPRQASRSRSSAMARTASPGRCGAAHVHACRPRVAGPPGGDWAERGAEHHRPHHPGHQRAT